MDQQQTHHPSSSPISRSSALLINAFISSRLVPRYNAAGGFDDPQKMGFVDDADDN